MILENSRLYWNQLTKHVFRLSLRFTGRVPHIQSCSEHSQRYEYEYDEIKANDLSFSKARSVLVTVNSYEALSLKLIEQLNLSIPKSKSQAKAFRKNLREEILNLIRWGHGIHLDKHHLKLFD